MLELAGQEVLCAATGFFTRIISALLAVGFPQNLCVDLQPRIAGCH